MDAVYCRIDHPFRCRAVARQRRRCRTAALVFVWTHLLGAIETSSADAQAPVPPAAQPKDYLDIPINIEAPFRPIPVKGSDGNTYLAYHLFLTNWSFSDLTIKSIEVLDSERHQVLARYDESELADFFRFRSLIPTPPRSEMPNKLYPRAISSGRTGVVFFWLTVKPSLQLPSTLQHRFTFAPDPLVRVLSDPPADAAAELVLDTYAVLVSKEALLKIGAPLRGGPWKCGNGPGYKSDHQFLTIRGGKARIAQRFAIDFNKVDKEGNILPNPFPDIISNEMFYGYGAEILAVADGTVAFVKDGLPENVPQASGEIKPAVPITRETLSGNFISLDLGKSRFAFYAHLQPHSIRVKAGDKVTKGEVIGRLGNSGNAVGPHLHFHIGDGPSLNGSEGVPFVFESFDTPGHPGRHTLEIPLKDDLVTFR
jgi:Peptidase family M23